MLVAVLWTRVFLGLRNGHRLIWAEHLWSLALAFATFLILIYVSSILFLVRPP